jgi:ribosomal protein S19
MPRSIWKGKYIPSAIFLVFKYNSRKKYKKIQSTLRNIFIFKNFLKSHFFLYNGFVFKLLKVTKEILFMRMSSFILTRKFGVLYIEKKSKKQKKKSVNKQITKKSSKPTMKQKKTGKVVKKK